MTEDHILEIFSPFSDPATPINVEVKSSNSRICLIVQGMEREYLLNTSNRSIISRHNDNRKYVSIDSLLASDEFAGLKSFASTQERVLSEMKHLPHIDSCLYMGNMYEGSSGISALGSFANNTNLDKIKVVLLDGPAGVGKTHLLRMLTLKRAEDYQLRADSPPILYVTSRGRRLSNLRDALAGATQELRAKFTFEQVPILVKRGLLQLVVDGFDELVDADGYQDAWSALRSFLEELGTGGVCILAGRDTFFDEQGFRKRLEAFSSRLDLVQAHLLPVSPKKAKAWLLDNGWPEEEVESPETAEVLEPGSYALRPYFLTALAEANGWSSVLANSSARAYLVGKFLHREANIIKDIVAVNEGTAFDSLSRLLEETALDMAERESEDIDVEYLSFLCEVAFERSLTGEDLKKLQHKAGSFALLEKSSQNRLRKFPHSEIRNYFLSHALIRAVTEGITPLVLRRGVLGSDFLEVLIDALDETKEDLSLFFKNLELLLRREISADRLYYNIGAILVSSLTSQESEDDRLIEEITVNEAVLSGVPSSTTLRRAYIDRLDVRGCDLSRVTFEDCEVASLIGDGATKFGSTLPKIHQIQEMTEQGAQVLRSVEEIEEWLQRHSPCIEIHQIESNLPFVKFFERVCRKSLRQFYLSSGGDDPASILLENPLWPELEKILQQHNRIHVVTKAMGGPLMSLIHIKEPMSLLSPGIDDRESQAVRNAVTARAHVITPASVLSQR